MAMSLAALILSGVKSLASILVETSMARTMSMPSVSTLSTLVEERGRAIATTIKHKAAVLRMNGIWRTYERTERPPAFQGTALDTLRWGLRSLISTYKYLRTRSSGTRRSHRSLGYSKNITRSLPHSLCYQPDKWRSQTSRRAARRRRSPHRSRKPSRT